MNMALKYRVRRGIAFIVLAVLTGAALAFALEFVWWLDENNPRAFGAVIGAYAVGAFLFVRKMDKEVL